VPLSGNEVASFPLMTSLKIHVQHGPTFSPDSGQVRMSN
jgi:hypothetical protein